MGVSHPGKLNAMLLCKCPRCRIGKIFYGSPYSLKRQRTNQVCSYCGLYFEIEPGYFYIAMYLSYGLVVIELLIIAFVLYFLVRSESPWFYCITLIPLIFLLSPINYRYSRVLLLHLFSPGIRYDPRYRIDN